MSRRHSQKISIPLPCNDHVEKFSEKNTATKTGAISGDNDSNLMQVQEHQRRGWQGGKIIDSISSANNESQFSLFQQLREPTLNMFAFPSPH